MQEAPTTPPSVLIEGTEVRLSYSEWIVDGEMTTFKAAQTQDQAPLTLVALEADAVEVRIMSDVTPSDLVIVAFDELDATGRPVEGSAVTVDCLRDRDACQLDGETGSVTATVNINTTATKVLVVHLMYLSDDRDEHEVDHLVGSWGAKVKQ